MPIMREADRYFQQAFFPEVQLPLISAGCIKEEKVPEPLTVEQLSQLGVNRFTLITGEERERTYGDLLAEYMILKQGGYMCPELSIGWKRLNVKQTALDTLLEETSWQLLAGVG